MGLKPEDVATFWDANGAVTLEERTYRFLHEQIATGLLPPGGKIVGSRMAAVLGVSRITIANALKRLASEGFVIVHPHREAVVASLDETAMNEIFQIRHALEAEVMPMAAQTMSAGALTLLDRLDGLIRASIRDDDAGAYRLHEREFHLLIYNSCNLPLTAAMLTDLWYRLEPYRGRRYSSEALLTAAMDDHRRIIDALRDRDPERAQQAMRGHVERGHERFLQVLGAGSEVTASPAAASRRPTRARRRRAAPAPGSLLAALSALPDARRRQGQLHHQGGILALVACGVLCGARSRYAVARWGRRCHPTILSALGLPADQPPSGATIHRILAVQRPADISRATRGWLAEQGFEPDAHGVHGEHLPAADMLAGAATRLREHHAGAGDGGLAGWDRFTDLLLGGRPHDDAVALAAIQLRQSILDQDALVVT